MPFVRSGPNEYLLVGRRGALENRGSAVQSFLLPGTIWVLVPGSKQEAAFEFTQETKDGIPLRFKGIIVYRVTDPVAAARFFDFGSGAGVGQITSLLTHVCLGELRHTVSHMTMSECIEQRGTTLSDVAESALQSTVHGGGGEPVDWGITVEVAQLAQVFIVDPQLRQQLEAEVRNEIKLKSDQSDLRTREETRLTEMACEGRVQEQKLASDQESLRREEELDVARLGRERRMLAEKLETERQAIALEQERIQAQLAADEQRLGVETPIRLLKIEKDSEVLREELQLAALRNQVKTLDVEHGMLLPRAQQELRREILPLEQAPRIVEAASGVLRGVNLSIYGEQAQLVGQLTPVLDVLAGAVRSATAAVTPPAISPDESA